MKHHSIYKGCNIYRNFQPNKLPWTAYCGNGWCYADTLAGIKELIRDGDKYS